MDERALQQEIEKLKAEFAAFGTQKPMPKRGGADRVARYERDKIGFGECYFPHRVRRPSPRSEIVTPEHRELLRLCDIKDDNIPKLYLGYRGCAKSTWGTVIDTLHKICYKRFQAGVIGSYDSSTAVNNFTSAIYLELLTNPRLQQDFGMLLDNATRASVGDFITNTGIRLAARGIGEMVKGFNNPLNSVRLDMFKGDDLQKRESARSMKQVRALMDWLWEEVYLALREEIDGGAYFDLFGTCVDGGADAMSQMREDAERPMLKWILPMILEQPSRIIDTRRLAASAAPETPTQADADALERGDITIITPATHAPHWPERFPLRRCEVIQRAVGASRFSAEMQQRPLSATHRKFRVKEWAQWLAPHGLITVPDWRTHTQIVGRIDPSSTKTGDRKAIVVLSSAPGDWRMYVRRVFLRQCSIEELLTEIAAVQQEFHCRLGIEDNALKDWLWKDVEYFQRERGVDLGLFPVQNSLNKEFRITQLESPFQRGVFVFQSGHSDQKLLLEEAELYPEGRYDDGIDAWAGAYQELLTLKEAETRRAAHLSTGRLRPMAALPLRAVLAGRGE